MGYEKVKAIMDAMNKDLSKKGRCTHQSDCKRYTILKVDTGDGFYISACKEHGGKNHKL